MSSLFRSPKKTKLPPQQAPIEEVEVIQEDAAAAGRRERKRLISRRGRKSTILSGIQSALKKRLGG